MRGRHYTEWVEPVKQLKREGRLQEAEPCCWRVSTQSRPRQAWRARQSPPWYYEQLGIVYRKLGDQAASDAIAQRHANALLLSPAEQSLACTYRGPHSAVLTLVAEASATKADSRSWMGQSH